MLTDTALPIAVRSAVVYRFFDDFGGLLYVGMTTIGPARWMAHAAYQPWWELVSSVTVDHFHTEAEAREAEEAAIRSEAPAYNVIHRSAPHQPRRAVRKRGTGSIYQRQDGRWVAQISLGRFGFGRRPARYCASRDEAETALAELLAGQ